MNKSYLTIPESFIVSKKILHKLISPYNTVINGINLCTGRKHELWDPLQAYYTSLQVSLALAVFSQLPKNGTLKGIKRTAFAKMLNCSSKAVSAAGKRLNDTGIFLYSENEEHVITVMALDKSHFSKNDNGYMYITSEFFNLFIQLRNKHESRISLSAAIKHDSNAHFGQDTVYSIEEFSTLFDDKYRNPYRLKAFFTNCSSIFKQLNTFIQDSRGIVFKCAKCLISKYKQKEIVKRYNKRITDHLKHTTNLKDNCIKYLVNTLEKIFRHYPAENVIEVIESLEFPTYVSPLPNYINHVQSLLHKQLKNNMVNFRLF